MTLEILQKKIVSIVNDYPIKSILLFGSRAVGNHREDSDVDLIMEFSEPITLLTLSSIRIRLEEILQVDVDIIHGPLQETDMIDVNEVVELYAV